MDGIRKELVYKSNKLIEGRYVLSAVAQKIAAGVISKVNPLDEMGTALPSFVFTIPELAALTGIDRKVLYRTISKYTKELKAIVIELERDDGKKGYRQVGLFREFDFDADMGRLTIEFEGRLEEHIRDFAGNFTKYQLQQLSGLGSRYSIRLYELLRKAHNMGRPKESVSFYQKSLDDLRLMLGVKPSAYAGRFDLFRRNVIDVAQAELAAQTDLCFDYEKIRIGRKVGAIKFMVRHNNDLLVEDGEKAAEESVVMPEGFDEGVFAMVKMMMPEIENDKAVFLASSFDKDILNEALMDLARQAMNEEIQDRFAYLMGILKNKRMEQSQFDKNAKDLEMKDPTDTSWAEKFDFDFDFD